MAHLPLLIKDLALILGAAGIITIFFKKLKQPVVLGYIIAGLLVGPNFKLFPTIGDVEGIKIWAEIGVVFLLFALGLEFSFKKLVKVGGSAAITGITELSFMMMLGYGMGQVLGWSNMDSMFLGGIIAISSTTIIFRAFDELGLKTKQFSSLVIGVLVIEDLVAILLMVLLSTVAVSQQFEGTQMFLSIGKLLFFLCLWFLMGIFLLPTFFKKVSRFLNSETLLVLSLALCLGMVVLADQVGFSAALGAFIMGSILAETTQAHKIEHLITSVKDLFGAIFFVSVGMLIDPQILVDYAVPVLILTLSVILGKTIFVASGALLAGRPLKQAVQAGTSMSQIGEFSFIIATLGVSLNVTSSYLYPIAVGVSVITTFTTPYMIKLAEPLYQFLLKVLPEKWIRGLEKYSSSSQIIESESNWKRLLNFYIQIIILNGVIMIALSLLVAYFLEPFLQKSIADPLTAKIIAALIGLIVMAPFIWALTVKKMSKSAYAALWLDRKYSHGPLVMLEIARNAIAVLLVGFMLRQLFSFWITVGGTLVAMIVIGVVFRQRLQKFYQRLEDRFLQNLHERELLEQNKTQSHLSPWDAHLTHYKISPHAGFIGKTLEELQWRETYGINIAFIERGNHVMFAPARTEKIFPFDNIGVIGTDQQMLEFGKIMVPYVEDADSEKELVELEKIVVDEHTRLKGLTIRESGIREKTNGLVVGIERKGERILNPSSFTQLEWDDIVWIVGNRKKIQQLYHP
ncbi:MAG: cation:proton antiporter [Sediminibacterium sp. Gen4]|jgi:monovalent cation:H+ antiporter-2, CPA2 family|uniref:cation:proton antiporter n=1 Tax=unclassified Sediminibacterium TaxID=2635961 RepID=UPI0015BBC004|nr:MULTISPECIES: cation:proton antiporter [unclassified Sediminibacterium]MBW0161898.1 cation:proton antiporter [Sediminibacterium sp.]MBW0165851.1 cation:proton antiporter [Sediminibacterium sp.]MDZ4072357.1 cation:proton antiporter [Sediminibacterium sp.]NWK64818.1 cation:proton antiporter [Sediminibacterium sp. Gen4]